MGKIISIAIGVILSFSSVGFGQKVVIPDQVQAEVIVAGAWRAEVQSVHINNKVRVVVKFKIGYNPTGPGAFTQLGNWKDAIRYIDVVDDPNTPKDETSTIGTDAEDAYKTGNTVFKTFLQNNIPVGWPTPQ